MKKSGDERLRVYQERNSSKREIEFRAFALKRKNFGKTDRGSGGPLSTVE